MEPTPPPDDPAARFRRAEPPSAPPPAAAPPGPAREQTLGRMLEESGFEVVLTKSFGRIFTWGYWLSRLRHYPAFVYGAVRSAISGLGIEDKFLYLDTRDSIEICARRK